MPLAVAVKYKPVCLIVSLLTRDDLVLLLVVIVKLHPFFSERVYFQLKPLFLSINVILFILNQALFVSRQLHFLNYIPILACNNLNLRDLEVQVLLHLPDLILHLLPFLDYFTNIYLCFVVPIRYFVYLFLQFFIAYLFEFQLLL